MKDQPFANDVRAANARDAKMMKTLLSLGALCLLFGGVVFFVPALGAIPGWVPLCAGVVLVLAGEQFRARIKKRQR